MGLIKFDGVSSDYLKWASLATAIQNIPTGAYTALYGIRHASIANWQAYGYLLSGTGAGVTKTGLSKDTAGPPICDTSGGSPSFATLNPAINEDTLFVVSKATGTSVPALSKKVGPSGTWAHANGSTSIANLVAAAQLQLGIYQLASTDLLNGWLAVFAMWNVALSQAQRIACGANWKTSDIFTAHPTKPLIVMELDVPKDALTNLGTGTIGTPTNSGTTFDSAELFGGWNFDAYGANFMSVM
ncbi:MAG TPA: hypothetical protein PKD12_08240 [Nitrospira sp.]|nr:hypothetical protein [Nitrospira sp.]